MKKKEKTVKQLKKEALALWKKKVFEVWGDACWSCGAPATDPHHFIPKSRNGLMAYDIMNGVPLCRKCHYKIHFSPNPNEVHQIVEKIRRARGKEWCDYIDAKEKIHKASFKGKKWLEEQIRILKEI